MENDKDYPKHAWSDWRPFPDPRRRGMLTAPFGAGCYELRRSDTGEKVLFGASGHVAARMSCLLPKGLGTGGRRNTRKRDYVLKYLDLIEYRTITCDTGPGAFRLEKEFKPKQGPYSFPT